MVTFNIGRKTHNNTIVDHTKALQSTSVVVTRYTPNVHELNGRQDQLYCLVFGCVLVLVQLQICHFKGPLQTVFCNCVKLNVRSGYGIQYLEI